MPTKKELTSLERAALELSEKRLTDSVKRCLMAQGWMSAHFHDSRRQVQPGVFVGDSAAKGFPDIVAIRGSRLLIVELKSEKGRLRPEQPEWLDAFSAIGAEVFLWRPSHWFSDAVLRVSSSRERFVVPAGKEDAYGLWVPK